MTATRYPPEHFDPAWEDDGTITDNVAYLADQVVGHRIVDAVLLDDEKNPCEWGLQQLRPTRLRITLDDGRSVYLRNTSDCCAYTDLDGFWIDPSSVDHVILGVGTTDGATVWHIYADFGDVMRLNVAWSCGNPFYYGYGFSIHVEPDAPPHEGR